jgi:UPF0716 protein FxsA
MAASAMTAIAGLLLIIPGFITDALALLLLLPPVQKAVAARMSGNVTVVGGAWRPARPDVVDLDPDDFARKPDGSSPWRGDGDPPLIDRR